jgi:mRNA interferase RelE/StbE
MPYRIEFKPSAAKIFKQLPLSIRKRMSYAIDRLSVNPRPPGCKKLTGSEDIYRIRTGEYRIIYQIQDKILLVMILKTSHRKDVYRSE